MQWWPNELSFYSSSKIRSTLLIELINMVLMLSIVFCFTQSQSKIHSFISKRNFHILILFHEILIYYVKRTKAMDSKQIFMIVAVVVALSAAMIATPVMAQNMTGGNVTGGNVTGGNVTGGNTTAAAGGAAAEDGEAEDEDDGEGEDEDQDEGDDEEQQE
jgi:hypothetical protein